jgi:hypothetical protein
MDNNDITRLETALQAGIPIPKDISAQILYALHQFKTGECKTLCRALGLRAPGISSIGTRQKIDERNRLIRTIAMQYPGTPWQKAAAMAEDIRHYPRIKHKALYAVLFSMEVKIPQTAEQLYNLLK